MSSVDDEAERITELLEKGLDEFRVHNQHRADADPKECVKRLLAAELTRLGVRGDSESEMCSKCYTGEPHLCRRQAASVHPAVRAAASEHEIEHLRRSLNALSSEYADFKRSVPNLDELRAFKELVALPDAYVPFRDDSASTIQPGCVGAPIAHNFYAPLVLRGLVTCQEADNLAVQDFFIGAQRYSCSSMGEDARIPVSDFKKVIAETKTWRLPPLIPVTLCLYNPTSLPVKFSGALVAKGEAK